MFSLCPFVPYVNVFFHILACFLTSYVNFFIFVLSLHVHLVYVFRPVRSRLSSQNPGASILVSRLVFRLYCIVFSIGNCINSFYV